MIRDFRVRTTSEVDALAERLGLAAAAWGRDWLGARARPALAAVSVDPARAEDRAGVEVWRHPGAAERWCATDLERGHDLAAALFSGASHEFGRSSHARALAAAVTARCLADLARRCVVGPDEAAIAAVELDGPHPLAREACGPGSGACEARFAVAASTLRCLISAEAVDALLGGRRTAPQGVPAAIVRRSEALGGQRVRARVVAGAAELPLAALSSLTVGDVIALDQRVDEPSTLHFPTLGITCAGYLCERDGCDALLLAGPEDTSASPEDGGAR